MRTAMLIIVCMLLSTSPQYAQSSGKNQPSSSGGVSCEKPGKSGFSESTKEKIGKNKAEGEAFFRTNAAKEGVVTTSSGLQYKIVTKGDGSKPVEGDNVECHFKGMQLNGEVFFNTYESGNPETFPLNDEILEGWREALMLMPVGSRWIIYVPNKLAYGDKGGCHGFGLGESLIFEIELVRIVKG